MKRPHRLALGVAAAFLAALVLFYHYGRPLWHPVYSMMHGRRTCAEALTECAPAADARLRPHFDAARASFKPSQIALLVFKQEKTLELWARERGSWLPVRTYPILAASGRPGPKLREGDRQVPEGIYSVVELNPNSSYHLSMKLDYPNEYDQAKARLDGRTQLGGDIFIHGSDQSIGCIAVGDEAIEELFVLAGRMTPMDVPVIIAPNDIRGGKPAIADPQAPPWVTELYGHIRTALQPFEPPGRAD